MINVPAFWQHGYAVVRQVFTPDEVADLRARVFESLRRRENSAALPKDILADPLLSGLVCDERLLDLARRILEGDPVYFGDASYAVIGRGYEEGRDVGGYHRDNTDRSDTNAPDWQGRYTLIRFGIYLQDHRRHAGGLMVRDRSHEEIVHGWRNYLRDRYLDTAIGDIGVWSMRIQHAGVGRYWRGFRKLAIPPVLQDKAPAFLQSPRWDVERAAVWISYGLDDHHLKRHLDYLLGRRERLDMWRDTCYDPEVLRECERRGLKVENMPERMRELLSQGAAVGMHKHHYQLPY